MNRFGHQPARPRPSKSTPLYPRLLGLGLMVAATACGGQAVQEVPGGGGAGGEAGQGGNAGGTLPDAGDEANQGGYAGYAGEPTSGGIAVEPYDAEVPEAAMDADPPEAAVDAGDPFPGGDIAEPFDAAPDTWVDVDAGEPPDAQSAGYAAEIYDAACESSTPGDPNNP